MASPAARAPFHVIAQPIGAICNIKCDDCFYLDNEQLDDHPKRSDFRMRDEVLERYVKQYIEAQPGAVELQQRDARPGQPITHSLQTNGIIGSCVSTACGTFS